LLFAWAFAAWTLCATLQAQTTQDVRQNAITQDATEQGASAAESALKPIERDILAGVADAGIYFTAPLRFSPRDWGIALGSVGLCAALIPMADESVRAFAQSSFPRTSFTDGAATLGRLYGELWMGAGVGASVYVAGLALGDEHTRVTGRIVIESLAFSGALTLAIKFLAGRSRPFTNDGAYAFAPGQIADERTAFSSGHTAVAFTVSAALAERVGNPWIGAGFYALASLTGLSRIYHDEHWLSDVVLGGAIGAGAGLLAAHCERERSPNGSFFRELTFVPTPTGIGVIGVFR
jgi:membrane-associated phospholipid phosphatase